ncbi:MAG: hypothetical protein V4753_10510 [Pseudomonadota bacterium]
MPLAPPWYINRHANLRHVPHHDRHRAPSQLSIPKPKITEAASAGLHEEPGFAPVPRLQIVTIEQAMALRERAVQLPARREDTFKRTAREEDATRQSALDL